MRTYEERAVELRRRTQTLERANRRRRGLILCAAASAACLALTVLAALGISCLPERPGSGQPGPYAASSIVRQGAAGYVVTGLIGFALGAALTAFCFRMKKNLDSREQKHDREP